MHLLPISYLSKYCHIQKTTALIQHKPSREVGDCIYYKKPKERKQFAMESSRGITPPVRYIQMVPLQLNVCKKKMEDRINKT